eukprot:11722652-Alexandrium_andersonii.AAC.1
MVEEAVIRWRWRRVEARHPSMASGLAMAAAGVPAPQRRVAQLAHERVQGLGAFVQPLAKLLRPGIERNPAWTAEHAGALKSAMSGRQWPQARRYRVGHDVA